METHQSQTGKWIAISAAIGSLVFNWLMIFSLAVAVSSAIWCLVLFHHHDPLIKEILKESLNSRV
jgi:Ca2+/Na+ antiporter